MTVDEAKALLKFRFDYQLAEHFSLHRWTVGNWRNAGVLPVGYAAQVELAAIKSGAMRVEPETARA